MWGYGEALLAKGGEYAGCGTTRRSGTSEESDWRIGFVAGQRKLLWKNPGEWFMMDRQQKNSVREE